MSALDHMGQSPVQTVPACPVVPGILYHGAKIYTWYCLVYDRMPNYTSL